MRLGEEPQGEAAVSAAPMSEPALPDCPASGAKRARAAAAHAVGLLPEEEGRARCAHRRSPAAPIRSCAGARFTNCFSSCLSFAARERERAARRLLQRQPMRARRRTRAIIAEVLRLLTTASSRACSARAAAPKSPLRAPCMARRAAPLFISGQIDRLLVTGNEILIVDFKTNRPPPNSARDVPRAYVNQMAAYARLLKARRCQSIRSSAALLYTAVPRLIALDLTGVDVTQITAPGSSGEPSGRFP